ncbi:hypothetical protein [Nonomuraea roseoviolacea]|uniref:Uncharacterized protein n=1 Tax=Nonomuraea roseoviolacea subsp. carminata TaxID=160689 RepID=A0ABT1JYZ6_9ACTN|nr:hypothetical protein [Nonomuraea roseoviolacea]MCP2346925.1 hypothetical protein [Nonomuraea roseoviolacea subsp. carminata]
MTHPAATATTHPATLIATLPPLSVVLAALALGALLWGLGYATACAVTPFGRCRHCNGHGKSIKPNGRVKRWCRRCDGTGLRLRIGRRLFNYLRRLHRDAR